MCLTITASLQCNAATAHAIAQSISAQSELDVFVGEDSFATTLHFSEEHSCACSLLDDSACWNAQQWRFHPEACAALAQAVSALLTYQLDEWMFEALWHGDQTSREQMISACELLDMIRHNQVGNRVTYRVVAHSEHHSLANDAQV